MATNTDHEKYYSPLGLSHDEEIVESEALLPKLSGSAYGRNGARKQQRRAIVSKALPMVSFIAGAFVVILYQTVASWLLTPSTQSSASTSVSYEPTADDIYSLETVIGAPVRHKYPPPSPANQFPSLFPTEVGYAGPTGTGAEPGLVATAPIYPVQSGAPLLAVPQPLKADKHDKHFEALKHWGNLSPWYSVEKGAFGINEGPETPPTCKVTGVHILHRHGARYPTFSSTKPSFGSPPIFAAKLRRAAESGALKFHGSLSFMNTWTYKMGNDILTPFGRQQLFDLGVSYRLKYGNLLESFTSKLPVFRTESQDRMLSSAANFALGFFGWPLENKFLLSVTIEENGFNNTLAPSKTCPNAGMPHRGKRGNWYLKEWVEVYLKDAFKRLKPLVEGVDFSIGDVYSLQQMCAYETVSLGYSSFCSLFTPEEWEGFEYASSIYFYYTSAFGSPVARVQGIGYVQELLARLTHTKIKHHNFGTNSTLDDDSTIFPLDQSIYVDATHDVTIVNVLTALNLSEALGVGSGEENYSPHKIEKGRKFYASRIIPFAANVQFQLLECDDVKNTQIRIILNDAVVSLHPSLEGCPKDKYGRCPVSTFIKAQENIIEHSDWEWGCKGEWSVEPGLGWNTTTGDPPKKED